ncbi:MAG: hypothetical protein ACFCA4_18640 [Cyanophyceae cyanobacterium]
METAVNGLDTGLQWLHGWMPIVAGGAGVWVWRRYGNLGWLLFGLIAGMRWVTGLINDTMALSGDSNQIKWFTVAIAVYATGTAIEKTFPSFWTRSPQPLEESKSD